jgi:hypothetical protein
MKTPKKITSVRKYIIEFAGGGSCTVEFVPVNNTPGFTHRVARDGVLQRRWLPEGTLPNAKAALADAQSEEGRAQ